MARATLSVLLAAWLASGVCAQSPEPLTIKGVALGDTIDKLGRIGQCVIARGGICTGKTQYGPVPDAGFLVGYTDKRVTSIMINFDARYPPAVREGLTKRFGEPVSGGCKEGVVDCWTWTSGDSKLIFMGTAGGVFLTYASTPGGF